MAQEITPAKLDNTVYEIGGFYEADGTTPAGYHGKNFRTRNCPLQANGHGLQATIDVGVSFVLKDNPLSLLSPEAEERPLNAEDVSVYKLKFGPPGATNNIVTYLQFYQKNITSTVLLKGDTSVSYFVTDRMSGCNFYIDRLRNGNLVCHHANGLGDSPPAKSRTKLERHNDALLRMQAQHLVAINAIPDSAGYSSVTRLTPLEYSARGWALEQKKVPGQSDQEFVGGTTVMGFRVAGRWQFWFQTSGRLTYTKTVSGTTQVFGREDVPLRIVETSLFWWE